MFPMLKAAMMVLIARIMMFVLAIPVRERTVATIIMIALLMSAIPEEHALFLCWKI